MKDIKKPIVDLNEIIDALDLTSDSLSFSVDKLTGEVKCHDEYGDIEDEEDEELLEDEENEPLEHHLDDDRYIALPDRWELNKYEIMSDFCHSIEDDEIQDNLLNAISGKGAFGRFRTAIECYEIQDAWYQYQHDCFKEIAIKFCSEHELAYKNSSRR